MFLGGRFFIKSAKKRALAVGDARPGDGFCDRHRYLRREDVFRGERARVARGTRSRVSFFFFCLSIACAHSKGLSLFSASL